VRSLSLDRIRFPGRDPAWIGAAVFTGHLAVYGLLALALYHAGVVQQYNVFFDSDPPRYLGGFAHGWQRPDWIHTIPALLSLPIRVAAAFLARLPGLSDQVALREVLAVWIAPLAGAGYSWTLFSLGRVLGLGRRTAIAITVLATTSVAGVVFFSIPESYGMSAIIALTAWLYLFRTVQRDGRPSFWKWCVLTGLAGAVTITESVSIACLYAAGDYTGSRRLGSTLLRTAGLVLVAVLFCGGAGAAMRHVYRYPPGAEGVSKPGLVGEAVAFGSEFAPRDPVEHLLELAALPPMTVFAPPPRWVRYEKAVEGNWKFQRRLSFAGIRPVTVAFAFLSLLLAIAALRRLRHQAWAPRSEPCVRAGVLACLGVGAYQGALHLVFGRELFLYAMHIQPAVLVLYALVVRGVRPGAARLADAVLFLLAAANVVVVTRMLLPLV
jgi:hypothetical protein